MHAASLTSHTHRDATLRLLLGTRDGYDADVVSVAVVDDAAAADGAPYVLRSQLAVWSGGNHGEYVALEHAYERALMQAAAKGIRQLAVGLFVRDDSGFPPERSVRVAYSTIFRFFREHPGKIDEVRLVVADAGVYDLCASTLAVAAKTYLGTAGLQL
jgi:O-acetyl-ADP-ribose deacetylase (regulator of RNase III)